MGRQNTIKVRMFPHADDLSGESGINTVVRKWFKYLSEYGIELTKGKDAPCDLVAVHAGMTDKSFEQPIVSHIHGMYWTGSYSALTWEWAANMQIVKTIRQSKILTVPSSWVAETFQRDMRINPIILPHGVDMEDWNKPRRKGKYVLGYMKNRSYVDVCSPQFLVDLAGKMPKTTFISTFPIPGNPPNVRVTGIYPHEQMAEIMRDAMVLISPIKETFGLLTLEAMAAGIPVLGYAYGGNLDLIRHGETGYLAKVGDIDDLAKGLQFCIENREVLGDNAHELAKEYTWKKVCEKLSSIYHQVVQPCYPLISVVIPCYNYAEKVGRAIESVQAQVVPVDEIIIIDDGSPDNGRTQEIVMQYAAKDTRIQYIRQDNGGVATARNHGIDISTGKYIICLDADDALDSQFTKACLGELEKDPTLGIAYTKLLAVTPDGNRQVSQWPTEWDFDAQLQRKNQIPTACMFKKEMWRRVGGYRQRYAPQGAGAEDAEFWLRCGSAGFRAKLVTTAPLFIYSWQSGQVSGNKQYREVDWTSLHPYCRDNLHPLASYASPQKGKFSHAVREYDQPTVSVVIPVGPGHKSTVFNALDSLEAQTFRNWEVILVDDTGDEGERWSFDGVSNMLPSYPYARVIKTDGKKGAGFARNRGVEAARGNMLLFLDADDNLLSGDALQVMVDAWNSTGQIVYTDYVNKSYTNPEGVAKFSKAGRLISYDEKSGLAMTRSYATEYDCERAIKQPQEPFYIWNLITCLFPKAWHYEIGGFDENMPSWEDWLYWLMMAHAGKCFARIPEPLVVYRFYTGSRRDTGIQNHKDLIQYVVNKLAGVTPMPCGCNKNKKISNQPLQAAAVVQNVNMTPSAIQDSEIVLIRYMNPNTGMHRVVGVATGTDYGYRSGGGIERFYMARADQQARHDWFVIENSDQPLDVPQGEQRSLSKPMRKSAR